MQLQKIKQNQKAEKRDNKVEVHYIIKDHIEHYEIGRSYASLNMIPIYNEGYVNFLSSKIKKELVKKQIKKLAKKGTTNHIDVDVLFPIRNFLLKYAIERSLRVKPIKRIFSSAESQKLLRRAYSPIFEDLANDGLFIKENDKFYLNPDFIFSNGVERPDSTLLTSPLFTLKESIFGYYYMINLPTILKYKLQSV